MDGEDGSESEIPRDSLFGPDAPPDLVLDESAVRKSIYQGWNPKSKGVKDVGNTQQEVRLKCLQGWFYRCSWTEKYSFLSQLMEMTTGLAVLERVLKCIDAIHSKDVVDSFARDRIHFGYDIVPVDDNRSLSPEALNQARREDAKWFLTLDAGRQVEIVLVLLRLGGGGLIFNLYKAMGRMYGERKEINAVLEAIALSLREITEETSTEQEGESQEESIEIADKYTARKLQQLDRRNTELSYFKMKYGISEEPAANEKKKEAPDVVDHVQLLPLWLNRKIMSYLSEKDLSDLKKTGKYWSKMVEESIRETATRSAINSKIARISGGDEGKETEENLPEDFQEIPILGAAALTRDLGVKPEVVLRIHKRNERMRLRKVEVDTWNSTRFEKVCCTVSGSSKLLAYSTPSNTVGFYSLRTGSRMGSIVTGLPSTVTRLAIHEEGFHVIVGCEDGSVTCVSIRKNEKIMSYKGHSDRITDLFASADKLISASEDETVKYFDLWSGLCLLRAHLRSPVSSIAVPGSDRYFRYVIAGTAEGRIIFIDVKKKKIHREMYIHDEKVTRMTEEGGILVTGSSDRTIRLWNLDHLENMEKKYEIRPYLNIQLTSPVIDFHCVGNQICAAFADGKLRLVCKLTGVTVRTMEVAHNKPIRGVYAVQEKDTTKMIAWHESGIELRTISQGRETKKKARGKGRGIPGDGPLTVKRYKATSEEDREKVIADRSCTLDKLRVDYGTEEFNSDAYTTMLTMWNLLNVGHHEIETFPRLRKLNESTFNSSSPHSFD